MIIWCGFVNDTPAYRDLGNNTTSSSNNAIYEIPLHVPATNTLSHNEGTILSGGTSPSIGTGHIKIMRDCAISGYHVGNTPSNPSLSPILIDRNVHHIMAYDLECHYRGPSTCSVGSDIMCASLVCSCGYKHVITRSSHVIEDTKVTKVLDNEDMATTIMECIVDHNPLFTLGHNVYDFDNVKIACALPSNSRFRRYFTPTSTIIGKSTSNLGLIMELPGINNFDTLRYLRKAMFMKFRSFKLGSLAESLDLSVGKMDSSQYTHDIYEFMSDRDNALGIMRYNVRDCDVVLELCFKLDLINTMVSICYATKSAIQDVLIYSTGAIATSCLSNYASNIDARFVWTRCDWQPETLPGAYVMFRKPCVTSNVPSIDFISMYPSIIVSAGISPESIDVVDGSNSLNLGRFDKIECYVTYHCSDVGTLSLILIFYGICTRSNDGCVQSSRFGYVIDTHILDKDMSLIRFISSRVRDIVYTHISEMKVSSHLKNPYSRISLIDVSTLSIIARHSDMSTEDNLRRDVLLDIQIILTKLESRQITDCKYIWIPDLDMSPKYAIDWIVTPFGVDSIVSMPECVVRFVAGSNIASQACKNLKIQRGIFKNKLKVASMMNDAVNRDKAVVYDRIQYAFKIAANSLYGSLAFRSYNTYSPRCAISITQIGVYVLTVSIHIVNMLGCIPIYGDTDSVMYTIKPSGDCTHLLVGWMQYIMNVLGCSEHEACSLLSANENVYYVPNRHITMMQGVVPKIVNMILSFTHLTDLKVEHQDVSDSTILGQGLPDRVHKRMIILAKKHYATINNQDEIESKGVAYVRRTGSVLRDACTKRFISIILKSQDREQAIIALNRRYNCIRSSLMLQTNVDIYDIVATVDGKTGRYRKVIDSINRKSKYIEVDNMNDWEEFEYNQLDNTEIDSRYYLDILDRCMDSVSKTFGFHDRFEIIMRTY